MDQTSGLDGNALVLAVGALGVVGIVIGVLALVRLRAISGRFSWVTGKDAGGVDTLPALLAAVEGSQRDIQNLQTEFKLASIESRTHFKRLSIVRYNAFEGVAGQQSYSLCLLDENQNGILISNLVGTNFSRSYAVEVKTGEPARPLGEEEKQALASAIKNGN
ncbi:MAG TPA: DUF4446 family protein [Candidatus Krumholzibacteria bacterium]|nr:DUF4446 family protein [Candidatus Krumholzibacteria bacterium]